MVGLRHPGIDFVASVGLLVNGKKSLEKEEEDIKEVDLRGLRQATKSFSDGPDPDLDPKFERGNDVTVIKRMTWTIPQPDAPKYRKDIMEGTEGVIESWADLEQRQVLLTFFVTDLPTIIKHYISMEAYTQSLKLTREYQESKGGPADPGEEQHTSSGPSSSASAYPRKCPDWPLASQRPPWSSKSRS